MIARGTRRYWQRPQGGEAEPILTRTAVGPERPTWMDDRPDLPCKRHDPNWWFAPEEVNGHLITTRDDAKRAVELCQRRCPMRVPCAIYGLRHQGWGIWGGIRLDGLHATTRRDLLANLERGRRAS